MREKDERDMARLTRERDEARAEAAQLQEILITYGCPGIEHEPRGGEEKR